MCLSCATPKNKSCHQQPCSKERCRLEKLGQTTLLQSSCICTAFNVQFVVEGVTCLQHTCLHKGCMSPVNADCPLMGVNCAKEQVQTCVTVASGRALSRVSQHQGRAAKHRQPLHCQFIWLQLVDNIYRPAGALLRLCMQCWASVS